LTSLSGDGIDRVPSVSGLSFDKHAVKIMQINSCLYHSKGMAEYLLVIDLDEFFVPRGNNSNFLDVLKSIEATEVVSDIAEKGSQHGGISTKKEANKSHGWANKHNHPACYITVSSDVVVNPFIGGYTDAERPWTGQR
jgi:metallophosphoesterase superfamily enzyme